MREYPVNDVVVVSGEHQRDSAIHILFLFLLIDFYCSTVALQCCDRDFLLFKAE